ncbi:MAG TPA: outer membrane beta-barrel protein, partial [Flavobacterium sp.]
FSDFNPNIYLSDRFTRTIGNPTLQAKFVHSGEFGYLVNGINFTSYISYTKNTKVNILEETNSSINGLGRVFNLASMHSVGQNVSVPIKFTNRWTSFNSVNMDITRSSLLSGKSISFLNYTISSNQNFQVTKRLKADLNLFYLPETKFDYGRLHEVLSLAVGLKMTTVNNKVSLSLNMNDILGRNMYRTVSQYPSVQREFISLRNERFYRLTARYNFNTGKAFSIRNKKSKNDNSEVRLN